MNLREQAEADLARTLEDTDGAGTPFTLIDHEGKSYLVSGVVGDISVLYSAEGEVIRNRSIRFSCRIKTLARQTASVPERGWRAQVALPRGKQIEFFVAGCDPDRTLGIYHLVMALDDLGGEAA